MFADADFADLYPKLGQLAHAPWRLALVTLMQFRGRLLQHAATERLLARPLGAARGCGLLKARGRQH